ncbi:MAG: urease accessory protein UreF [Betaproteobacteria bacterium]|nr:urease accessory protein UreF [Betaproteobacteria bacterium]
MQLSSPALPIGGFAYSQGLEWAIEEGTVSDYDSTQSWITDMLHFSLGRANHFEELASLNTRIYALKETAELRQETAQMGQSLARLFSIWDGAACLSEITLTRPWTYPAAHAGLCASTGLDESTGMTSFAWSWCENQVLTAIKHVPLGQTDGQRLLQGLHAELQAAIQTAQGLDLSRMGSALFGLAIASARHETQYSRLFRS